MINVVTVDANGNERTVNMGELNEPLCKHEIYTSRCQVCGGAEPMNASVAAAKPKRARNRVATKTTVTKTIEKELTFTEADLRRMLRIPEGAELGINDRRADGAGIDLVATWTVTR